MLIDCSATPRNEESCSRVISGVPMLMAITTSAPIAFTMSTGRFFTSPPSPSILPSMSRGAKIPGTDMLPRIAMYSGPRSKTTALPSTRLVATARNGMGSRSKLPMSSLRQVSPCSSSSRFCPVSAPVESLTEKSRKPSSRGIVYAASSTLRRTESSCRGGWSEKNAGQSSDVTRRSSSPADMPET